MTVLVWSLARLETKAAVVRLEAEERHTGTWVMEPVQI